MNENKNYSAKILLFSVLLFAVVVNLIFMIYLAMNFRNPDFAKLLGTFFSPYMNSFENMVLVLAIFTANYFFVKFTGGFMKAYLEKAGRSKKNVKLFMTVYRYFMWITVFFITLSLLFRQVGSLITSIGLIGFGVTIALQKPILNFVGWVTIIFTRNYKIGDTISMGNSFGKVYDIRVMYTNIGELNADGDSTGKSISVPNEFVFTNPVVNYTKGTGFFWDTIVLPIPYKSDWKKAVKITEQTIQDYYDKNIKRGVKKAFKGEDFAGLEKVTVRFGIYEKGLYIKARYMVDFIASNEIKTELSKLLLEKLNKNKILIGKVENV
mgnify:CR=1 FL=1